MEYSRKWIFEDVARGAEEVYFRQKERELIENLKRRFRHEQDLEHLAEEVGVHDERILRTLDELGFSRDTVTILHLVPLVQVAWSDGEVTEAERTKICEVAALRGVATGSGPVESQSGSTRPRTCRCCVMASISAGCAIQQRSA